MNDLIKKENLDKMLGDLNRKHQLQVKLKYSEVLGDCFLIKEKTIILNNTTIKNHSFGELIFILSHEYRHAMQYHTEIVKDIIRQIKKMQILIFFSQTIIMGLFPFIGLFVASKLSNPIMLLIAILLIMRVYQVVLTKINYNKQYIALRHKLELDADIFAHQQGGLGATFFLKVIKNQYNVDAFSHYFLLEHIRSTSHPPLIDRFNLSLNYPPNLVLIASYNR